MAEAAMAMAGPAMTVASSVMKVGGTVMAGQAEKQKYGAQANQMLIAAADGTLRAKETDSAYREELGQTLSNLRAIQASKSIDPLSPTSLAIEERAYDVNDKRTTKNFSNEAKKSRQAELDGQALRRAGSAALGAAYLKAAPDVLSGIQGGLNLGKAAAGAM